MKERTAARVFLVAYPIAVAVGLTVHPEPLPVDGFFAAPLLWPIAVLFRRFKATTSGLEVETDEVKDNLTTAVDALKEETQAAPARDQAGKALALAETHTAQVSIGASAYIVVPEEAASPRDNADLLPVSDDAAVQLAGLRIAIERELQRTAELAHLQAAGGTRMLPLSALLRELLRRELLPRDLAVPLTRVIDVANRAIHGAPIEKGAADVVADLGPRLIDGLRRLPSTSSWLATLVRVRAGEQMVWEVPGEELASDVSIGLGVGEIQVHVSPSLPSGTGHRNDVVRFVGTTPQGIEFGQSLLRNSPAAWIQDRRILGTAAAKAMAPWLIDNVVQLSLPPKAPATLGFRE